MAKLISVSEEVYNELSSIKGDGSFNELLKSLITEEKRKGDMASFEKFFGVLKGREAEALRKTSKEFRKNFKARDFTSSPG